MNRLHTTAAALIVLALASSGCARNRSLPSQLAPSRVTTIGVNGYLWRAAVDTVSFAPLLQANPSSGVIITDWYTSPRAPGERVKLTVAILDAGNIAGMASCQKASGPLLLIQLDERAACDHLIVEPVSFCFGTIDPMDRRRLRQISHLLHPADQVLIGA